MTLVVLGSVKGAPGTTTAALALALAWPLAAGQRALVVDADPAGADLASGFLQGAAPVGGGLAAVAASREDTASAVVAGSVALDGSGSRLLLTGAAAPRHREAGAAWARLRDLSGADWVVLVDVGRVDADEVQQMGMSSDALLLVSGSSLRAAAAVRPVAAALHADEGERRAATGSLVRLLVVGDRRPYPVDELAASVGLAALPSLAWDPRASAVLSDGTRGSARFARTALMRSAAATARALSDEIRATQARRANSAATAAPGAHVDGHAAGLGVRP
jgi:MinD-like ATPase involved in chromosome partitioning or flagellar assembly